MVNKAGRTYEAPAVGAAATRIVRALVRRSANGDTEALEELIKLEAVIAQAIRDAGRGAHDDAGYSWSQLSYVTGTSRAAVAKRFKSV